MPTRNVSINGVRLDDDVVSQLESAIGHVQDGAYWYDPATGVWGTWNGPAVGVLRAGLPTAAPMPAHASGGNTGVFINGRELHAMDVAFLRNYSPVWPGRYTMDARWNVSYEQGGYIGNLALAMRQAGGGGGGGGGKGFYRNSYTGATVGSSGGTSYVSFSDGSGVIID